MEENNLEATMVEENHIEKARADFVGIGKTILLYIALQIGLAVLLGAILMDDIADASDASTVQVASTAVLFIVSCISVYWGMKKLSLTKQDLQLQKGSWNLMTIVSYTMIGMGLSMLGSILVVIINTCIAALQGITFVGPDFSMTGDLVFDLSTILMVLLIAPIFEELLFRGVILRTLLRYDTKFTIIVSGILFGMMHMNLVQGIPTMLFGFVLAFVCVKSNSLYPSILIHFFNNLISLLAGFFMASTLAITILGLFEIACIVYAITRLFKARASKTAAFDSSAKQYHYYKVFFNAWSIIVFLVIVVISTLTSFATI